MKRIAIQGIAGSFHEDAAQKYFDDEIDVQDNLVEQTKTTINLDARRRVDDYRAQKELERLINDDLDYFDDIA